MEHVLERKRLGGLLAFMAAALCAFVLALTMSGAAWADLTSGELAGQSSSPGDPDYVDNSIGSYGQTDDENAVVFKLYTKEANGSPVLVKEYKKKDLTALAAQSTGAPLAYVYGRDKWEVISTSSYVRLDDLFADAGVSSLWRSGSVFYLPDNTKYTDGYAFDDYVDAKYFPKTKYSEKDNDGAVSVPSVFAIKSCSMTIGASKVGKLGNNDPEPDGRKLASEMLATLNTDENQSSGTGSALRFLGGISESNYLANKNCAGNRLWSNCKSLTLVYEKPSTEPTIGSSTMHRMYNPNSGEHFFTSSDTEAKSLKDAGWKAEGDAWKAPEYSKTPVFRLYNPFAGEHHYTMSNDEVTSLVKAGWNYEGIGWYSDDAKGTAVYRVYNPYEQANNHHYTTSKEEAQNLVSAGWKDEGTGFYGLAA